jgi:spore coat protein H
MGFLGACGDDATPMVGSEVDVLEPREVEPPDVSEPSSIVPIHRVELTIDPERWAFLDANPHGDTATLVSLVLNGVEHRQVELEMHGGYAREVPKKSFRFKFVRDVDIDLFGEGVDSQRRFVLKASWIDRSFLREKTSLDIALEQGGLAPRTAYAELIVNGVWHGFYLLVERIDRDWLERVGLEDENVHLYKAEDHRANWEDKANALDGFDIQLGEEVPPDDLKGLLTALTRTPATESDFATAVAPVMSLNDFVIWQRVHTFIGNRDTFTKNYYLYHNLAATPGTPDDRFRIVTWDADATFGNDWEGSVLPADQRAWHGTDRFSPRLFSIALWKDQHFAAYRTALATGLAAETLVARVRALAAAIAPYAERDLERWQTGYDFDTEIERLDAMIRKRHAIMRDVIGD